MRLSPILRSLLAAFALAIALPAAVSAQPPDPRRPPGGLIERNAERLGLQGAARDSVQSIVTASRERHTALLARLDAAHAQMRELLSQPIPDADAVMAQADAIGALETELQKNRLRAILDIREQLSPEQRAALIKIRDEEHARRDADPEHGECMEHPPGERGADAPPPPR